MKIVYESIVNDYKQCMEDILGDTSTSHLSHYLKSNKGEISIQDGLILLDAKRIFLPKLAIKPVVSRLHIGHAGQEKTLIMAQQLYFWHGKANDIKTIINNCD